MAEAVATKGNTRNTLICKLVYCLKLKGRITAALFNKYAKRGRDKQLSEEHGLAIVR